MKKLVGAMVAIVIGIGLFSVVIDIDTVEEHTAVLSSEMEDTFTLPMSAQWYFSNATMLLRHEGDEVILFENGEFTGVFPTMIQYVEGDLYHFTIARGSPSNFITVVHNDGFEGSHDWNYLAVDEPLLSIEDGYFLLGSEVVMQMPMYSTPVVGLLYVIPILFITVVIAGTIIYIKRGA